jgi:hypothetical protein
MSLVRSRRLPLSPGGDMPVIENSTRIWDLNIHWPLYSQCAVWDPVMKGVFVYECIRERECPLSSIMYPVSYVPMLDESFPGTQPPNHFYWRLLARR